MEINPENDPTIADEAILWRRVPCDQVIFDDNLKRFRPSSQSFQNTSGTTGMSVNFADESSIEDTLKGYESHALVSFDARLARMLKQGVIRSPLPDNAAHAEVTGQKTKSVRNKFSIECAWVVAPPT